MFNDNNGFTMPVMPAYGGNNGFGNGFLGGDGIWALLIFAMIFGGFGGGFGGFGGLGNFALTADGFGLYPWLNNSQNINDGFRDQMMNTTVQGIQNAVTSGFGDVQLGIAGVNQNICQSGNNTVAAINNSQNALSAQLYNNEIASLNRSFAEQTANVQGFNNVQSQLANCCYDNRLTIANLGSEIAREACATREANTQNTQIVLNAISDGFRLMSDQRYQDKIDAKNDEIAQLRQENLYARGQASQIAQNQTIVDNIYDRLNTCPVGTTPVYGRTPIFTCNGNNGCSNCNGSNFFN